MSSLRLFIVSYSVYAMIFVLRTRLRARTVHPLFPRENVTAYDSAVTPSKGLEASFLCFVPLCDAGRSVSRLIGHQNIEKG